MSENSNKQKVVEETKVTEVKVKEPVKQKLTPCYLRSKADYIVPVCCNGQHYDIQPFGSIKVIKELTTFDSMHTKYLTFVKI